MAFTDEDRLAILGIAQDLGLRGTGGECGMAAIAINHLLFEGKGTLVAAVNWPMYEQGRFTGHAGVRDENGSIWDAEGAFDGEEGAEEFMAWGMLDFTDVEYRDWLDTPEEAEDARIIEISERDLKRKMPCDNGNPASILRAAIAQHLA
jgi:hypothetical protein